MKRNLALLSMLLVSGAHAADNLSMQQQIDQLQQRVGELEKRLDAIESPEVMEAIHQIAPPANPGDSTDVSNWSRLKVGFDYTEVNELLGNPVRIRKGTSEYWFYSDKDMDGPYVKFLFKKVNGWSAPE